MLTKKRKLISIIGSILLCTIFIVLFSSMAPVVSKEDVKGLAAEPVVTKTSTVTIKATTSGTSVAPTMSTTMTTTSVPTTTTKKSTTTPTTTTTKEKQTAAPTTAYTTTPSTTPSTAPVTSATTISNSSAVTTDKTGEYYYAAQVWNFFRQRGYSEAVTSAIIGNMMIETSGGSLALNPTIYSSGGGYYGLCQWALCYKPEVAGMSIESQLEYLHADMAKEFRTFGFCYSSGFTYDSFLAMTDPGEAAVAFAAVYERCSKGSYEMRRQAARTAYNYFS